MRHILNFLLILVSSLIFTSCMKQGFTVTVSPGLTPSNLSTPSLKTSLQSAPGSTTSPIVKYIIYTYNAAGQRIANWDGHTYESIWYGWHLLIQITGYKLNARLGDPAYVTMTTDPNTGSSVSANGNSSVGGGYSSFTITFTTLTTGYTYNDTALKTYDSKLKDYFNASSGTGTSYPQPPGTIATGASVKKVYGKIISTTTGDGYAIAEINWTPTITAPTNQTLPYRLNQTSILLPASVSTANGITTVTVVDNSTLAGYRPTITFKLNADHSINRVGSLYSITCKYALPGGASWTQQPESITNQPNQTTPVSSPTSFGLLGSIRQTNGSSAVLAIWVTYNYVANPNVAYITYNDSDYFSYDNNLTR